mmetsp:Transcript_22114/g.35944  ORF Transcript_22114/g.35944 Transcript_22114/m.35944 type:complete len:200 (-) Transcript_22114:388-987(-)
MIILSTTTVVAQHSTEGRGCQLKAALRIETLILQCLLCRNNCLRLLPLRSIPVRPKPSFAQPVALKVHHAFCYGTLIVITFLNRDPCSIPPVHVRILRVPAPYILERLPHEQVVPVDKGEPRVLAFDVYRVRVGDPNRLGFLDHLVDVLDEAVDVFQQGRGCCRIVLLVECQLCFVIALPVGLHQGLLVVNVCHAEVLI